MNIQINNFGGIYGKMALAQKKRSSQMRFEKIDYVSESVPQPAKTGGKTSPYEVYARMRKTGVNLSTGSLSAQAKQPLRAVDNERYSVEKSEITGYWQIYDKQFGKTFLFDPSKTSVQTEKASGKNYVVAEAPTGGLMDVIPADEALMETLAQFLNVDGADSIATASLNDKYTVTVDEFTGLECLKVKGKENDGAWLMVSDKKQLEKLQELADLYRETYPNLVKSNGVAMGLAQAEAAGHAVRTPNGILMIACNGMEYMDDANPQRGWSISYSIDDARMYTEIMDAMAEGYIAGKDTEDFKKWKTYFEEKGLEYERVFSDDFSEEEAETIDNVLTKERLAALTGNIRFLVSENDLSGETASETGVSKLDVSETGASVNEPESVYVNPNTMGLTSKFENTGIKNKAAWDESMSCRPLNPIDDMMWVLSVPIPLVRRSFLNKLHNSVQIAAGQRIPVNDGYVITVKPQGVEVSEGNNPYNTDAYMKAQQTADSLASLLRNAAGILKYMGYSEEERDWHTEGITNAMAYLGIDTSKEFTINGMKYHKDKNGWYESETSREAQEEAERIKANNRTYLLADEKTKKRTAYVSNYYLETAPESVKTAWQEAMEEADVNPFADGFGSIFTKLATEQDFRTGGDDNLLGDTEESCLAAVNQVLERIENLLGTATKKQAGYLQQEKAFYTVLAGKIGG